MIKGQIAAEFMTIFSVFLIAVIMIALAVWNNVASAERAAADFEAERVVGLVSGRINTAYLEGDGFSIGLAVPEKLAGLEYALQIDGNTVWITAGQHSYSAKLLTGNITGTPAKGGNTVRNVGGTVVIS